jgi:hypothetical protein
VTQPEPKRCALTDAEKLEVYDLLRESHLSIKAIYQRELLEFADDEDESIVDAVDTVLYMAESHFARMSD